MNKNKIPTDLKILSATNFMLSELINMLFDKGVLTLEDYEKLGEINKKWMEMK